MEFIKTEELSPDVQPYWFEGGQHFFRTYFGNEVMYWNETTGEWVDAEDATCYAYEVTKVYVEQ